MLNCKITLTDSPHPVIISKNPGFRALYLARQNEFVFFRLINTKKILFSFLAAGFGPKNLAFAGKIMVLPESGGAAAPHPPGSYAYAYECIQLWDTIKPCGIYTVCMVVKSENWLQISAKYTNVACHWSQQRLPRWDYNKNVHAEQYIWRWHWHRTYMNSKP